MHGNQTGIRAADDATVTLNVPFGLVFGGEALTLRKSKVYANTEGSAGLYLEGEPSQVDLGTLSEAGLNELYDNTGVQLLDARPGREELNLVLITLSETRLQGVMPEPGTYLAEGAPYFNEPYFSILGVGNGIRVY